MIPVEWWHRSYWDTIFSSRKRVVHWNKRGLIHGKRFANESLRYNPFCHQSHNDVINICYMYIYFLEKNVRLASHNILQILIRIKQKGIKLNFSSVSFSTQRQASTSFNLHRYESQDGKINGKFLDHILGRGRCCQNRQSSQSYDFKSDIQPFVELLRNSKLRESFSSHCWMS